MRIVKLNKIKCLKCGDVLVSEHRYDFKWCSCRSCAVDGGNDYLRRCGNKEDYQELSETEELPAEELDRQFNELRMKTDSYLKTKGFID